MKKYFLGLAVAFALVGASSANAAYMFNVNLTIGSAGQDVVALQDMLIAGGHLVMPAGVSKGYFGALTQTAVAKWQAANGIAPAAGYFGPASRAKANMTTVVTPTPTTPSTGSSSTLGSGEASLEDYNVKAEEDEVAEGEAEVVATLEFDVEDGDASVQRVDLTFEFTGDDTEADDEPWDALAEVRLLANGKEIASADLSDEDDWQEDTTPFVFRLSGLNYVVKEGDTAEIEVEVTAQDNVDGADSNDSSWIVYVDDEDLRATDGEGIDSYVGDVDETADFTIVGEGEGDDLELVSSEDEIDEGTIVLDEDDATEAAIFSFALSADDSDNDIEINTIEIDVALSTSGGAIDDLVEDFWIEIDGEKFDVDSYDGSGDTETLTFDIDGDFTVDAESEVEVVLMAEFSDMASDSDYQGSSISASLDVEQVDAEGKDDVTVGGTDQNGEDQTLLTEGVTAEYVSESFTKEDVADEEDGTISLTFDVTAVGADFLLSDDASELVYDLTGATETDVAVTVKGETVNGDDQFTIKDGETDRVTLSVKFASTSGFVKLEVTEIGSSVVQDIVTENK